MCNLPIFRPQLRHTDRTPLVWGPAPDPQQQSLTAKSGFSFSGRSLSKLETVDDRLQRVAKLALDLTVQDFGVTEGIRSIARQRELVAAGKSQTLNSRHITGHAIDLLAYDGAAHSWNISKYLLIANAFVSAADKLDIQIRWGGAWHIPDIRVCAVKDDPGATMMELYRQTRKRQGRRVFIDGVHFEIPA